MARPYEGVGSFQEQWRDPPPPFNPDFDPGADARWKRVSESMQGDGYYSGHTREECRLEWRRRYDEDEARTRAPAERLTAASVARDLQDWIRRGGQSRPARRHRPPAPR